MERQIKTQHNAIVSANSGLITSVFPKGVYSVEAIGPIEKMAAQYFHLRELLQGFLARNDRASVHKIRAEMEDCLEFKWADQILNGTPTAALNDMLDKYWAGSAYTAGWFMGLVSATSFTAFAAADTSASHAGWLESAAYTQATRPAITFAAAAAGSKATSAASVFSINATITIKGAFAISNSTKSGTTGILASTGLFLTGDKPVADGYTLNSSFTASMAEAV